MSAITVALAAGTGGIAPSLVHLAQGFIKENTAVPGIFYFVGVAIFFFLGGLVAFFFAETESKKAFFLGIGLPALISTAQSGGTIKAAYFDLMPTAYAQGIPSSAPTGQPKSQILNVEPVRECKGCEIWFTDRDGRVISKELINQPKGANDVVVPPGASQFGVYDPTSNFRTVPVPKPSNEPVTVEYQRQYSPANDLRRGLGNYDIKSYDSQVQIKR